MDEHQTACRTLRRNGDRVGEETHPHLRTHWGCILTVLGCTEEEALLPTQGQTGRA